MKNMFKAGIIALGVFFGLGLTKAAQDGTEKPLQKVQAVIVNSLESYEYYVNAGYKSKYSYAESEQWMPWLVLNLNSADNKVRFALKVKDTAAKTYIDLKLQDSDQDVAELSDDKKTLTTKIALGNYWMLECGERCLNITEGLNAGKVYAVEFYSVEETGAKAVEMYASYFVKKPATQVAESNVTVGLVTDSLSYVKYVPKSYRDEWTYSQSKQWLPWVVINNLSNADHAAFGIKILAGKDTVSFQDECQDGLISEDRKELFLNYGSYLMLETGRHLGVNAGNKGEDSLYTIHFMVNGEVAFTKTCKKDEAPVEPTKPVAPTVTPAAGAVAANTEVVIALGTADSIFVATAKDSAHATQFVKFTADAKIKVVSDTVIRAFAMKGEEKSDTATFKFTVKPEPTTIEVNDLAALNALYATITEEQTSEEFYSVKGKVVITAIAGTDIYVQDSACTTAANHSMLLYRAGVPSGAKIGDVMTGVKGKLRKFKGLLEMDKVVKTSLSLTGNTAAVVIDSIGVNELKPDSVKYQNAMIRLVDVAFANAGDTIKSGENYEIFKGTDTTFFRASYKADYINTKAPAGKGTIIAYAGYHNGYQVSSRSKADMIFDAEGPITVAAPTFTPNGGEVAKNTEVTIALGDADSIFVADKKAGAYTKYTADAKVTVVSDTTFFAFAMKGEVSSDTIEVKFAIKTVANQDRELAGVSIYPNPSTGNFTVSVPVAATIEIFAANGQRINRMSVAAGNANVRLNNSGIYFVRVTGENGQAVVKRIVVR